MSERPLVCMIFDEETGNAVDAFAYSADELERRLKLLKGRAWVTIRPSPFVVTITTSSDGAA